MSGLSRTDAATSLGKRASEPLVAPADQRPNPPAQLLPVPPQVQETSERQGLDGRLRDVHVFGVAGEGHDLSIDFNLSEESGQTPSGIRSICQIVTKRHSQDGVPDRSPRRHTGKAWQQSQLPGQESKACQGVPGEGSVSYDGYAAHQ